MDGVCGLLTFEIRRFTNLNASEGDHLWYESNQKRRVGKKYPGPKTGIKKIIPMVKNSDGNISG